MHRGRQTGLSGNIETLPDAIRGACGPSNDHCASSNGYAHAADSSGRTRDRPNSRSSTTADRAADDCAAHRAASRRALRERKTFDFSRLRATFLAGRKRDST
jgi:hypothetical protein